jgi:hypothetical protein
VPLDRSQIRWASIGTNGIWLLGIVLAASADGGAVETIGIALVAIGIVLSVIGTVVVMRQSPRGAPR